MGIFDTFFSKKQVLIPIPRESGKPPYCGIWEMQRTVISSKDKRRGYARRVGKRETRYIKLAPVNRNGKQMIRVTHYYPCNSGKCSSLEFFEPAVSGQTISISYRYNREARYTLIENHMKLHVTSNSIQGTVTVKKSYENSGEYLGTTTYSYKGVRKLK